MSHNSVKGVADRLIAAVGTHALAAAFYNNKSKNIMKMKIKNPFKKFAENYAKNRREEAIAQVHRDVQLREFEGKIWICYNNIPIVEERQLKDTLCNTLSSTREAVCRYYKL